MAEVIFYHPTVSDVLGKGRLVIETGANSVRWSYHLNTVVTPTFGGEVVQNLSVFIDDLTIEGDVKNSNLEEICEWMIAYFQVATQGNVSLTSGTETSLQFDEHVVEVSYPERGWNFDVRPTSLPGVHWGLEVVVPTYQITAAIIEPDPAMTSLTIAGAEQGLDEIPAGIGYVAQNPFSNPFPDGDDPIGKFDPHKTQDAFDEAGDWFNNLIPSYAQGDFGALSHDVSKPAFLNPSRKQTTRQTNPADG